MLRSPSAQRSARVDFQRRRPHANGVCISAPLLHASGLGSRVLYASAPTLAPVRSAGNITPSTPTEGASMRRYPTRRMLLVGAAILAKGRVSRNSRFFRLVRKANAGAVIEIGHVRTGQGSTSKKITPHTRGSQCEAKRVNASLSGEKVMPV